MIVFGILIVGLLSAILLIVLSKNEKQAEKAEDQPKKDTVVIVQKQVTTKLQTTQPDNRRVEGDNTPENRRDISTATSFAGAIGPYPLHLQLTYTGYSDCNEGGKNFEGTYYYDRYGPSNTMIVTGYTCGNKFYMTEFNKKGVKCGSFEARIEGNTYQGTWYNDKRSYQFHLK
jgi:hypothetical protein